MFYTQPFFETFLGSCFRRPAIDHGVRVDISPELFEESNGAPSIISTANNSSASGTNSSALRSILCGRTVFRTTAVDLVFIGFVKVDIKFSSRPYSISFQRGKKMNSRQHLATGVRLGTTHVTRRR